MTLLESYRDDGVLARTLARVGRAVPVPPLLLVVTGVAVLGVLAAVEGDGASDETVAAGLGWFVLLASLSAGRPHSDRFAWAVPAFLRLGEYGAYIWVAANASDSTQPAAFALIAALVFHHYDLVYRTRFQGQGPPGWVGDVAGGFDGRLILVTLLFAADLLPAGMFVLAAALGALFVVECATSWARLSVRPVSIYEDEEDEGD